MYVLASMSASDDDARLQEMIAAVVHEITLEVFVVIGFLEGELNTTNSECSFQV